MFPECLNGTVRCFDDYTYHTTLDPLAPIALKHKLQAELRKSESQYIIAKLTQPTDWDTSLVIVEKENGRLHLRLDPTDLNKA